MTDEDDRDENSISKTRGEDMVGIYFEQIMNSTISEFISLANKINEHVSKHMQTDSMLSFELLEALNNVINMIKSFRQEFRHVFLRQLLAVRQQPMRYSVTLSVTSSREWMPHILMSFWKTVFPTLLWM